MNSDDQDTGGGFEWFEAGIDLLALSLPVSVRYSGIRIRETTLLNLTLPRGYGLNIYDIRVFQ